MINHVVIPLFYHNTTFDDVKHTSLFYFGVQPPVEQVEVLMVVLVVDDLMTKLNNLTKDNRVLSSAKFELGKRDETKTAITAKAHICAYTAHC